MGAEVVGITKSEVLLESWSCSVFTLCMSLTSSALLFPTVKSFRFCPTASEMPSVPDGTQPTTAAVLVRFISPTLSSVLSELHCDSAVKQFSCSDNWLSSDWLRLMETLSILQTLENCDRDSRVSCDSVETESSTCSVGSSSEINLLLVPSRPRGSLNWEREWGLWEWGAWPDCTENLLWYLDQLNDLVAGEPAEKTCVFDLSVVVFWGLFLRWLPQPTFAFDKITSRCFGPISVFSVHSLSVDASVLGLCGSLYVALTQYCFLATTVSLLPKFSFLPSAVSLYNLSINGLVFLDCFTLSDVEVAFPLGTKNLKLKRHSKKTRFTYRQKTGIKLCSNLCLPIWSAF